MFEKDIEKYKNDEIEKLIDLIKFKSVSEESDNIDAPFGIECKKALDYILKLGEEFGFRTKNVDGYCGYIEFGEGNELLGIIGHLDVVPAKVEDGWNSDPFEPIIKDNKIYGRGAIDDKGPVIASLYAMKFVADNCKINKRVRLILGLNEEKNWKCISHYKMNEEHPTVGFSPDADFPCIYAEKSIITARFKDELNLGEDVKIIDAFCDNNAINVVPKYAGIIVECKKEDVVKQYENLPNIKSTIINNNTIKLETFGKSAHAAYPEQGDNALTKLLLNLPENNLVKKLNDNGFFEIESPKFLGGESTIDESGKLTSNLAQIKLIDNKIELAINYRVPVKIEFDFIKNCMNNLKNDLPDIDIVLDNSNPKLYVPKDSYLVKTLTNIFNEETGLAVEPITTGGGTYARAFNNCVAFGAIMPGEEETYHQANEYININNFILATKIYARAIYELSK